MNEEYKKLVNDLIKMRDLVKDSQLSLQELYDMAQELSEESQVTPLWEQVLNQKEFYNGHGQMVLYTLTIGEVKELIEDLSQNCDSLDDLFYLQLFSDEFCESGWTGSIYQSLGNGEDKLWLGIDNVVIGGEA